MQWQTDDVRIIGTEEVIAPQLALQEYPISAKSSELVVGLRTTASQIIAGKDPKLLVIVGPCSIHDPKSAIEYAGKLSESAHRFKDELCILMRVYFEKPRTTIGWKGLLNDPHLNGSFNINEGLLIARKLLRDIMDLNLGVGTEYLDPITPQYLGDLVAWSAIGARTTQSQIHRQLASGLSCPVGFKNTTQGDIRAAANAIKSASDSHIFLSVTKAGNTAIFATRGNQDCHAVLRGGEKNTNYDAESIKSACEILRHAEVNERVMVDTSHANSRKNFKRQIDVCGVLCDQIADGEQGIMGTMIESHLIEGNQSIGDGTGLVYGQSITDACLGWDDTEMCLESLASAVRVRNGVGATTSSAAV
ncbi:MAG: 3-deoxy-7-phosphoheptulonate synthase [Gammaproteobacteria bacterium]|nr:3-deoxy-7-phosphoheptulonate synthase [Gammaproteobacteria bacterium]